jgi:hypothetical protein
MNKLGIEAYSVVVLDLHYSTKASYLIGGKEFYCTSAELCVVSKSEHTIGAVNEANSCSFKCSCSGFGGLGVACWPLVPKFAGSNPVEAVGFLRAKKSSARLPSEWN